ncbi:DUF1330 domain-containing protein [Agathobaculum sp.]|uniref:DUF1330 domain-containing protein n=1 Tax=Agathobaculum sp. TaxID=2048138 RepID=UPI002A7F053D|nr:DUF1330 domain-containing protein [Agathobaculum sp.]MDY3617877.1 DUF1330 domain-containing protein [Agathobaculum sp.]
MKAYFIVSVQISEQDKRPLYEEYIQLVRPIVESHGGVYLVRTENMEYSPGAWRPDRLIVIEFPDRASLDRCFASEEYRAVAGLRIQSVEASAVIVEGE